MAVTTFLFDGTDATQDLSMLLSATGTVVSATDQQHTGPRSVKLSTGAGPTDAVTRTPDGMFDAAGSQYSIWFRTNDVTVGSNSPILRIQTAGGAAALHAIFINTGATLTQTPTGATAVVGATVLSVNTWYRISLSFYITNSTTFAFKLYINGVLESTATAGTMSQTAPARLALLASQVLGTNADCWFDDLVIVTGGASSSAQPDLGTTSANSLRVTNKRPFANGTTNGFTTQIGSGGSGYGTGHAPQVNEQPLSVTNGWSMVGAGAAVTEEYTIEGPTVGDFDLTGYAILDYMGWIYASSLVSETGQIKVGGSASNIALTSANTMFTAAKGSTTFPAGGTDIGIITATDLTTVSLYEAGVLFALEPSVAVVRDMISAGFIPFARS